MNISEIKFSQPNHVSWVENTSVHYYPPDNSCYPRPAPWVPDTLGPQVRIVSIEVQIPWTKLRNYSAYLNLCCYSWHNGYTTYGCALKNARKEGDNLVVKVVTNIVLSQVGRLYINLFWGSYKKGSTCLGQIKSETNQQYFCEYKENEHEDESEDEDQEDESEDEDQEDESEDEDQEDESEEEDQEDESEEEDQEDESEEGGYGGKPPEDESEEEDGTLPPGHLFPDLFIDIADVEGGYGGLCPHDIADVEGGYGGLPPGGDGGKPPGGYGEQSPPDQIIITDFFTNSKITYELK